MAKSSKNAVKMNSRKTAKTSKRKSSTSSSKAVSNNKKNSSFRDKLSTFLSQGNGGIPMGNEIWLVASFGIMILMIFSNFGFCAKVGEILSNFFFGIFGCSQYIMPIVFFAGVAILIANDYSLLAIKKCCAGFVLLMMVSAFAQVIYQDNNVSISDLMSIAIKNHWTGGIIGGGFAVLMKDWFGLAGAIVIILCITIISLIVLTQKSFVAFFKSLTVMIKETAKARTADSPIHDETFDFDESDQGNPGKTQTDETDDSSVINKEIVNKTETESKLGTWKRKRRKSQAKDKEEQLRLKQCEDKVKEIEEAAIKQNQQTDSAGQKEKEEPAGTVPAANEMVFTASEEIAKKDSVRELHPEDYPLIVEDDKNKTAQKALVFHGIDFEDEEELNPVSPHELEEEQIHTQELKTDEEETNGESLKKESYGDDEKLKEEEITVNSEMIEQSTVKRADRTKKSKNDISSERSAVQNAQKKGNIEKIEIKEAKDKEYIFPPLSLLTKSNQKLSGDFEQELKNTAKKLQQTLKSFGVNVTITDISCGPTVTRYEMFPEQGTKVSKIVSLTDDIKLNLAASDIRIEAPIPGKAAIGIEVPNRENVIVHFRDVVDNRVFRNFKSKLAFAVGKDIGGKTIVADLAKMPHLLIAGATGSGKSVCLNTLIVSILYKAKPEEVKLIMIDPKMVELNVYNGIPHLLIPVVTDPKKASGALNWAVAEMTNRYSKFSEYGVRNIEGYNKKVNELISSGQIEEGDIARMPQIVIIIDELADLMMVAPGEVEDTIVRLSQLARAAGIHLVIATQRPSVNVITGLIKANVPSRIAFAVSSGVDSRTIIDMNGAEKLLGKGDMLFYPSGYQKPIRVQGAFVSDQEISDVVDFLKNNEEIAVHDNKAEEKIEQSIEKSIRTKAIAQERDEYFEAAARFFVEKDKATIGMLQRMFKIGFNRAARIVDQLAQEGIVGPEEGTKPRKVLMSSEQLEQYFDESL